ncbi:hypothetical protein OIO90_004304 [Microbotryomycetes sp. JL221]|nr:hypothetical protein OIO90_004304 [Microbotryomycetes sp. JL221]
MQSSDSLEVQKQAAAQAAAWHVLNKGSDQERRKEFRKIFDQAVSDSSSTARKVFRYHFPIGPGNLGPVDRGDFAAIRDCFRYEEDWKENGKDPELKVRIMQVNYLTFLGESTRFVWPWERMVLAMYVYTLLKLGLAIENDVPVLSGTAMGGLHQSQIRLPDLKYPEAPYQLPIRLHMLHSLCTMKTSGLIGPDLTDGTMNGCGPALDAVWIARQAFTFFNVPDATVNAARGGAQPSQLGFIHARMPWIDQGSLRSANFNPIEAWKAKEKRVKAVAQGMYEAHRDQKWYDDLTKTSILTIGTSDIRKNQPFASIFVRETEKPTASQVPNPRLAVVLAREFTVIASYVLHAVRETLTQKFDLDSVKDRNGKSLADLLFSLVVPKSLSYDLHWDERQYQYSDNWKESTFGKMNPLEKARLLIVLQSAIKWFGLAEQVTLYLPCHVDWRFDIGDSWQALQAEKDWVHRYHNPDSAAGLWISTPSVRQATIQARAYGATSPSTSRLCLTSLLYQSGEEHERRLNKVLRFFFQKKPERINAFKSSYEIKLPSKEHSLDGLMILVEDDFLEQERAFIQAVIRTMTKLESDLDEPTKLATKKVVSAWESGLERVPAELGTTTNGETRHLLDRMTLSSLSFCMWTIDGLLKQARKHRDERETHIEPSLSRRQERRYRKTTEDLCDEWH